VDLATGEFKRLVTPASAMIQSYQQFALSPDETTVYAPVWGSAPPNSHGVIAIDLASGRERPVFMEQHPNGGVGFTNLALSPDGRTLAIIQLDPNDHPRLFTVSIDGRDYRQLYMPDTPGGVAGSAAGTLGWSRDGHAIYFAQYTAGVGGEWRLMRIASDGGRPEFTGLTGRGMRQVHKISLSPDGSRMAFADGELKFAETWALDNLATALKRAQ
jgi:Tol biopolymer transport system component